MGTKIRDIKTKIRGIRTQIFALLRRQKLEALRSDSLHESLIPNFFSVEPQFPKPNGRVAIWADPAPALHAAALPPQSPTWLATCSDELFLEPPTFGNRGPVSRRSSVLRGSGLPLGAAAYLLHLLSVPIRAAARPHPIPDIFGDPGRQVLC